MNEFPYSVEASAARSSGILLIAFGESYRNEARRSLASLKRYSYISNKWNSFDDWHPRVWLPQIRGLLPMGIRRSDPLLAIALGLRRLFNEARWLTVPWRRRSQKVE